MNYIFKKKAKKKKKAVARQLTFLHIIVQHRHFSIIPRKKTRMKKKKT